MRADEFLVDRFIKKEKEVDDLNVKISDLENEIDLLNEELADFHNLVHILSKRLSVSEYTVAFEFTKYGKEDAADLDYVSKFFCIPKEKKDGV